MKSVVVFSERLLNSEIVKTSGEFILDNIKIKTGIIEEEDITLENSDDPKNHVLVKKKAFSCNYRDKPFILHVNNKIKNEESKNNLYFSHIGSEFVGEVIDIGEKVKNFKIGDRVIPNISYPSYNEDYSPGLPSNSSSKRIEIFKPNKLIVVSSDINISDETLAAFPIAAFTAYSMIRKVVNPGDKVLVTAAKSNTSLAVISALTNYQVEVFVMTSNNKFNQKLKEMGVKDVLVINPKLSDEDNYELTKKLIKIGGFNAVIDPFFDIYLPKIQWTMQMDSKYITCGLCNQFDNQKDDNLEMDNISLKKFIINMMINNISIIGNCIGTLDDGIKAINDCERGKFKITIDSVYSEGEENLFFEKTFNFKERFGKVVYKYKN